MKMFNKLTAPSIGLSEAIKLIERNTDRKYQYVKKFLEKDTQTICLEYEKDYPNSYYKAKKIKKLDDINGLTKKDAVKIYENRFTPSGVRVHFYDQLKSLCPVCDAQLASQLDHVLPKSQFPQYVVTPLNLVPLCASCNKSKGDVIGFNAYYQSESDLEGLIFSFNFTDPTNFIFLTINNNPDLECFMKIYDIKNLLTIKAAQKIKTLLKIFDMSNRTSIDEFKKLLEKEKDGFSTIPKWQNILFTNLLSTDGKPEELFNNRSLFS